MRYQLWYVRCDDPSSRGRLRISPSNDVTKLASGIAPMTQLFAEDMWLVDGFLKVYLQKDGPEYFVPAKHVQWSEDGCMQSWKPLSDDMWFSRAWYLQPADFNIKVSHGGDLDQLTPSEEAEYRAVLGKDLDAYKEYTYCSLEVGWPIWRKCHITIGYLISMHRDDMDYVWRALNTILETWLGLTANPAMLRSPDRVDELLVLRPFMRQDPSEVGYDVYELKPIHRMSANMVTRELDAGRLKLHGADALHYASTDAHDMEVRRLHQRDVSRHRTALLRAEQLPDFQLGDNIEMALAGRGLGGEGKSLLLADLLFYLEDRLRHMSRSFRRNENGKLLLPKVTCPKSWHCSRQDDWFRG